MLADYRGIDVGQTNGGRSDPGSPDWVTLRLTPPPGSGRNYVLFFLRIQDLSYISLHYHSKEF